MTTSNKRVAKDVISPRRAEIDVPNKKPKLARPEPVHVEQIGMFHRNRGHSSFSFTFCYSIETKNSCSSEFPCSGVGSASAAEEKDTKKEVATNEIIIRLSFCRRNFNKILVV